MFLLHYPAGHPGLHFATALLLVLGLSSRLRERLHCEVSAPSIPEAALIIKCQCLLFDVVAFADFFFHFNADFLAFFPRFNLFVIELH